MIRRIVLEVLILLLLVTFVAKEIDIKKVLDLLSDFPRGFLFLILGLSFSLCLLKAYRFFVILKNLNFKVTFWQVIKVYIAGQAVSPLPAGETMRGIFLKKETGIGILKSSGPVITQAFQEFLAAAILTIAGSLFLDHFIVPALSLLFLIFFMLFFLTHRKFHNLLIKLLSHVSFLKNRMHKMEVTGEGIRNGIFRKHQFVFRRAFLGSLGIGFLTNIIGGLIIYILAINFSSPINFYTSIFIYSASIVLSGMAVVVPGGLGFTEGGMTGLLVLSNTPLSNSIAIVLLFRLVTLVFYILLGLLFMSVFYTKLFFKK